MTRLTLLWVSLLILGCNDIHDTQKNSNRSVSQESLQGVEHVPEDGQLDVRKLAFNPDGYFPEYTVGLPMITVKYTADDWGFPVWSMAIIHKCIGNDDIAVETCGGEYLIRIVQASYDQKVSPRKRAAQLLNEIYRTRDENTTSSPSSILSSSSIEWMEGDTESCEGTRDLIEMLPYADWSPIALSEGGLHMDLIFVTYSSFHPQRIEFISGLDSRDRASPAQWAQHFYDVVQPCLKPAGALPPWQSQTPND